MSRQGISCINWRIVCKKITQRFQLQIPYPTHGRRQSGYYKVTTVPRYHYERCRIRTRDHCGNTSLASFTKCGVWLLQNAQSKERSKVQFLLKQKVYSRNLLKHRLYFYPYKILCTCTCTLSVLVYCLSRAGHCANFSAMQLANGAKTKLVIVMLRNFACLSC